MDDSGERSSAQQPDPFDMRQHGDTDAMLGRLTKWLGSQLGPDSNPQVTATDDDIANGMSSSTVLFDMDWTQDGSPHHASLVGRLAPDPDGVPIFPQYDLAAQFNTMRTVAEVSSVPVPQLRWLEKSGNVLGQPFFVMDRVAGQVPPDMLPYTFGDSWVFDASTSERAHLQESMIGVLADLHAINDVARRFPDLDSGGAPSGHLGRHLERTRNWYDWSVTSSGVPSPLVETALDQLTAGLPANPGDAVLSWGDSRIGNVLFDGFTPAAVLDWEMADLGPRELDVVWLCYSHTVFQDLAVGLGAPGLPDFLTIGEVTSEYSEVTGHSVSDLDWYLKYAAVRWACAFLRTGAREAHLNGTALPDDGDTLLHNRTSLAALVNGTFSY